MNEVINPVCTVTIGFRGHINFRKIMYTEILTSYNAVYYEIGFFKSAFVRLLEKPWNWHTMIQVAWTLTLGMRNFSRRDWQTAETSSQKPNKEGCYNEVRDGWWSKPDDYHRLVEDRQYVTTEEILNWLWNRGNRQNEAYDQLRKRLLLRQLKIVSLYASIALWYKKSRLTASWYRTKKYDCYQRPTFRQDT